MGRDVASPLTISQRLDGRSGRAIGWALLWRATTRLLGLVSTIVLARLLGPAEFGLVALATSFSNAVEQFGWIGSESAIAREAAPERDLFDTGFTLNLGRSVLLAAVIAGTAEPVALFLHEPRLVPILLCLAAATAALGAENIGVVEFRRAFAFDKEFWYLLLPRLASIGLAIAAAGIWHTYWALVAGIVSSRVLRVLFSYRVHPFRPRLSVRAWRRLVGYSAWTWLIGLTSLLRERADTLVIGRLLATTQAGYYSVGYDLGALSFAELVEGLQRPTFSAFVAAQHGGVRLREPLLRLTGAVALVCVPVALGASAVAAPLVRLVAGARWDAVVPTVQLVSLCGPIVVIGSLARTRLVVLAEFRTVGAVTLLCGGARLLGVIAAVGWLGLTGGALAAAASLTAEGALFTAVAWWRERIAAPAGLRTVGRPVLAGGIMAATLWATGLGWSGPTSLARLAVAVALGAAVYGVTLAGLWIVSGRPDGAERDAVAFARRRLGLNTP